MRHINDPTGRKRNEPKYLGCIVEGCDRPHRSKGYCLAHYQRVARGVALDKPIRIMDSSRVCTFPDCDRTYRRNGFCDTHAAQQERFGRQMPIRPWATTWQEYVDRFWTKVDKTRDCWFWTGYCNPGGYGVLGGFGSGDTVLAHRVAWHIATGLAPPDDKVVRHSCDNPPCVNPAHLLLGDHQDNSDDCVSRGRSLKGERHPLTPLTTDNVLEIRSRYAAKESPTVLAKEFGVTPTSIGAIVHRRSWTHLP